MNPTRLQLEDKTLLNKGIVMDVVAKPITKEFCKVVSQNGGDILDVGFGLGYSANFFTNSNISSYTCIEINPEIYQTAIEWAKDKPNVEIILGDWIDVIPTLDKKFDGIFMDTYGDDFEKYKQFESYCESIANENCVLSIYEYPSVRNLKELNLKRFFYEQGSYELILKPFHNVCWTYFSLGTFRKDKVCEYYKNQISNDLSNQIIKENIINLERTSSEKNLDGLVHKRNFKWNSLKPNKELFDILNKNILKRNQDVDFEKTTCWFVKYEEGDLYDRHVETIKGIKVGDSEQYGLAIDIILNDEYDGGEIELYDNWLVNDRNTFSEFKQEKGSVLVYNPYNHITYRKIDSGVKYQIIILIKNKDLKKQII